MHLELQLLQSDLKLNRTIREHASELFSKLDRYLTDPASRVDLRLELIRNQRKGQTHYVHVAVAVPREPHTFHAEALAEDFRTALDRLYGKAERYLRRRHKKLTRAKRDSERKEKVSQWIQDSLTAPRRLLGRFFRRGKPPFASKLRSDRQV